MLETKVNKLMDVREEQLLQLVYETINW